jgi:ribonuclease HII
MVLPDVSFEKKIWKKGFRVVVGVDEVGRGSFAGPIVAAVAGFAPNSNFDYLRSEKLSRRIIINDSKRLTAKQRERSSFWIKRNALCYGIGWASVSQINRLGIKKASEVAFRKAIKRCGKRVDYLLIDAFYIPYVKGLRRKNQKPIIKGDTKSVSIAAASIIAKVYRDKLMQKLGDKSKYRFYGWGRNKGYGTSEHRKAIKKYGMTRLHRKQFVATWIKNSSSFPVR